MPSPVLQLRIRQELFDAVDAAAKGAGMDRKVWVVQALEAALGRPDDDRAVPPRPQNEGVRDGIAARGSAPAPASPRAPVSSLGRVEPRRPDNLALARMRKLGL